MNEFFFNTYIISGHDALKKLDLTKSKQVFITTDKTMIKTGNINSVIDLLKAKSIDYEIFDNIEPDPSVETIIKGLKKINSLKADTIIAIGGGSVIDAAKSFIFFKIESHKKANETCNKPLFIAIPTTSGTGSEVTSYAVITDKENRKKIPLISKEMLPDIAILDPKFTMTVPPQITAETGMDVLTHAIESYVSKNKSAFTIPYSEYAIKIVFDNLLKVYQDGKNIYSRTVMHEASCIAGVAFNNAGLGLVHAMAHALGAYFNIPHGRANAILLANVVGYNAKKSKEVKKQYSNIAKNIGFSPKNDIEGTDFLKEAIFTLNKNIGIKRYITEYDINKNDFKNAIKEMSETAIKDITIKTNPTEVSIKDIENIYLSLI